MKRADGIIIAVVLIACGALFAVFHFGGQNNTGRVNAEIYVSGRLVQTLALSGTSPRERDVAEGKLTLTFDRSGVAVSRADCPSQTCVHTGKITLPGQMIVCLPNRVIVKLVGDGASDGETDVIAR